jgi:D-aminoacyl-tRNA deacylase
MIGLIQRVSSSRVEIESQVAGQIDRGLLVLLGVQRNDGQREADRLLEKLLTYRVFEDADQRMNLSLLDVGGDLLVVSQFTLAANTQKGTRPGFSTAAPPADGERWYDYFVSEARRRVDRVETGRFGAHMSVHLVNEGPVTFWLEVTPERIV